MPGRKWFLIALAALLALSITLGTASAAPAAQCGSYYTVQYGDGLYRISLRFGVSMASIARANNLYNWDVLYAGQTLYIPCAYGYSQPAQPSYNPPPPHYYAPRFYQYVPGSGVYNQPGVWPPPNYPGQPTYYTPGFATCSGMVPTSPLGGLAHSGNTFYWNPASGVTNYRVNVYGVDVNPGQLVASFISAGTQTNVGGDLGGLSGFQFAWEVQGLLNGAVVCTSQRYTMFRAAS